MPTGNRPRRVSTVVGARSINEFEHEIVLVRLAVEPGPHNPEPMFLVLKQIG